MKTKAYITSLCLLIGAGSLSAQSSSKAWELSVSTKAIAYPQMQLLQATKSGAGYLLSVEQREALLGLNLSATRELSTHTALSLEQTLIPKPQWIALTQLSLEYRLGAYFSKYRYIDPYLSFGVGYLYNSGHNKLSGEGSIDGKPIAWGAKHAELWQHKHHMPLSLGAGTRLWLNERWGIKLSGGYLASIHAPRSGAWTAELGLSYRIGGKSKEEQPQPIYMEKYIERLVEKPVVIEKQVPTYIGQLLEGIYFKFASTELTESSAPIVEKLALLIAEDKSNRYLITGFADALGSDKHNQELSLQRAKAIAAALVARGIAPERIKCRGVGKRIAVAPSSADNDTRKQDRKILLEVVDSDDYWRRIE